MNTNIASLYEFTLQQMVAESYFEGVDTNDTSRIRNRLILGTNREGYKTGNNSLNEGYPGYTRMTSLQADEFLSKYKIVHQWSDDPTLTGSRPRVEGNPAFDQLNNKILANTGLSATLIQKRDSNGVLINEYTLAIRSTEFRDWADGGDGERDRNGADLKSIAFTGFALAQQDALERYYAWLKVNVDSVGDTLLPAHAKLNVTGYSLGGNLATVFTEIHQNDLDIQFGETVTMNGAGRGQYDFSTGSLSDMVGYYRQVLNNPNTPSPRPLNSQEQLIRNNAIVSAGQPFDTKNIYADPRYLWAVTATQAKYNLSWQSLSNESRTGTLADARITQLFGYETINNTNFTANSGIHGPALRVGIESQPGLEGPLAGVIGTGDFGNGHSIALLADSLALQRVVNSLVSTFDLRKFISLLPATSNRTVSNGINANYEADPLENVLDALRRALLGPNVAKTEYKDGASGFGDISKREGFYSNLTALNDNPAFKSLAGKLVITPASGNLAGNARYNFSALVALQDLSPVYIAGVNPVADAVLTSVWQNTRAADYGVWTADKSTGTPKFFTDQWISDRAKMLTSLVERNTQNIATGLLLQGLDNTDYIDLGSGQAVSIRLGVPNSGTQIRKISFGKDGVDDLRGGTSVDHLYGGAGDDTLTGLGGNDYLEGGTGFDSYAYTSGFGEDTILDADGLGTIRIGATTLNGGKETATGSGLWISSDKQYRYTQLTEANASQTLTIFTANAGERIKVLNFQNHQLGINLDGATVTVPGNPNHTIVGDLAAIDVDPVAAGVQIGYDALDNVLTDPNTPEVGRKDTLYDSAGNDHITSGAGDDTISATRGGDDWIETGSGRDFAYGAAGQDLMVGGADGDILDGGAGDDRLYADIQVDVATAISLGNTATSIDAQGDWLAGGAGTDTLIGSSARDVLTGGDGADLLIGGAGDDDILGDIDWTAQGFNWSVVDLADGTRYFYPVDEFPATDGGADAIYAGNGNDHAWGGMGDDAIYGEGGDTAGFNLGDGHDTIMGPESLDGIVFGAGITSSSVTGSGTRDGLLLSYGSVGDDVQIGDGRLQKLQFADRSRTSSSMLRMS